MRILQFTAGAANMYCGTCLRDNALAAELKAQGHDVLLLPLYTPTLTDERNVSERRVFFGGLSIYLQQKSALFRKMPRFVDRLWDSPSVLKRAAQSSIPTSPEMLGELTVSLLKGEHGPLAKELSKLIDWLRAEPPPDVVCLPYTLLIALARPIREALRRPVTCTLQGEELFLEGLVEPYRTQSLDLIRENLPHVDAFLAVSHYCAEFMMEYLRIPRERMYVAPLGINLRGYDIRFKFKTNCFVVGYFARVAPEKSLHLLCEAYRLLRRQTEFSGATLEVAGYLAPEHRGYMRDVERRMKEWGLAQEFQYRGVLTREQKIDLLRCLDVLSVPSAYREPKGIYALEAMAAGVPVVEPRHGAFPELIEKTQGGLLFEPNNVESLAEAILSLWKDRARAEEIGRRGAAGVREHYSAQRMAARALEVYAQVAGSRAAVSPS